MAGLYIHIPFCKAKCRYCDFISFAEPDFMEAYCASLRREMRLLAALYPEKRYDTVFFGGGTPSILPAEAFAEVLSALRGAFAIAEDAEITIECNPGTLDAHKLAQYRAAGVNRLSMGLQSANDALLKNLGRIHRYADFVQNYECARAAGFDNISADIMYGVPEQTIKDHLDTIEALYRLGVEHISAYSLILEEGTPLYTDVMGGAESLPDEDACYEMHVRGRALLESLGYERYEISNYARAGFASRHNLNYWDNGEYLGLGVAAHSALTTGGKWTRFSNTERLGDYLAACDAGERPLAAAPAAIPKEEEMFECVMLGLRKVAGLSLRGFHARFGQSLEAVYAPAIEKLCARGWLLREGDALRLSDEGLDMQNAALMEFMGE